MGLFEQFPYTNFHEINLDWIIKKIKNLDLRTNKLEQFFNDLGIQEYINAAVKELADTGRIDVLLADYVPYVTPDMFGAVGDGVSSDGAAIDSAFLTGKPVYFPSGKTYTLDRVITLHSNQCVQLDSFIIVTSPTASFRLFDERNPVYAYEGQHNIHIYGCGTIDCNGETHSDYTSTPIRLGHNHDCVIEGITIKNVSVYHAIEISGSRDITVRNVTFDTHWSHGVTGDERLQGREFIQIETVTQPNTGGAGFYDSTPSKDIHIIGCTFKASKGTWGKAVGDHEDTSHDNVTVEGCFFNGGSRFIINFVNAKGLTVKTCVFKNTKLTGGTSANDITVVGDCSNITIDNNLFIDSECQRCALLYPGESSKGSSGVRIINNTSTPMLVDMFGASGVFDGIICCGNSYSGNNYLIDGFSGTALIDGNTAKAVAPTSKSNLIIDSMHYHAGDSVTIPAVICNGMLTGDGKNIIVCIPTPKRNYAGSQVTADSGTVYARKSNGGYVLNNKSLSNIQHSVASNNEMPYVVLTMVLDSAESPNNSPVSVQLIDLVLNYS